MTGWISGNRERILAAIALAGVVAGAILWGVDAGRAADVVWGVTDGLMLVPLTWSVVASLLRRDVGVDAIALISMAGALALGQYLAGAVVALMLAGGNALEEYAGKRARRALTALVERQPRIAHRRRGDAVVTLSASGFARRRSRWPSSQPSRHFTNSSEPA